MFGSKKTITDRVKETLTEYLDTKFDDYRGQIALDLARGLASLAGLIAIWTLAIVCLMFVSIALALLLGWIFSFFMSSFAYVLSFLLIAIVLLSVAYYILKHKEKYIEAPVFKIMSETLRSPETWGLENRSASDKEPKETETTPHKRSSSSPTKVIPTRIERKSPPEDIQLPPSNEDIL
ncbi:phage holin family protein [Aureispira anguillae]|uniref:Phage holin family protein n=1 Tax=Aureispira anguillae TaxID=2864201 RepID=A0A915YM78_9BACT|nr:phage holin family protein [Aureispira anguillae]BDS15532.1 phage holin family protein [Aureispira anguillae]